MTCAICGRVGIAGQIGRIRVCGGCWNLYGKRIDGDARVAGMHARLVAVDQEIENDTRVVDLRQQIAFAQGAINELREFLQLRGYMTDYYEWKLRPR